MSFPRSGAEDGSSSVRSTFQESKTATQEDQIVRKRRGGYTNGSQTHEVKFRATTSLFETLQSISDEGQCAMAMVIRELVSKGLERRQAESDRVAGR
jgi:hypothetical protein